MCYFDTYKFAPTYYMICKHKIGVRLLANPIVHVAILIMICEAREDILININVNILPLV